jgi:hypothetical protein
MELQSKNDLKSNWCIRDEDIARYEDLFNKIIKPRMALKYLSHLVTTVEELINTKRKNDYFDSVKMAPQNNKNLIELINKRALRFFSIQLIPLIIPRIATVRYYDFGLNIFYNPQNDQKHIRIAIAHELGHIINKMYLNNGDTEQTADLFSFIVMVDKNEFYNKICKDFIFRSEPEIRNTVLQICPIH